MFCENDIVSKNFVRHMETYHREKAEVKKILDYPKGSKERRQGFSLLRNNTNFDLYIKGIVRPYRNTEENNLNIFHPCIYCKGLFKEKYLRRHTKACLVQKSSNKDKKETPVYRNYISVSQTLAACSMDSTNVISRLNVKEQVRICYYNCLILLKLIDNSDLQLA